MKPTISHRCPSCGVRVRDTDPFFSYECGKPLSSKAKKSEPAEAGEVSRAAEASDESAPPMAKEAGAETITDVDTKPPASEAVMASANKSMAKEAGAETITDVDINPPA